MSETSSQPKMSMRYDSWTLVQLRAELKKRGVVTTGRKKELVTRLESLDIMCRPMREQMEVEYNMQVPPPGEFADIHGTSEVPQITMERILQYLGTQEKKFEEKIKHLYEERYIRYVRMATTQQVERCYVTGAVWAEMQKKVSYKVDVALDRSQVIQEAQCECGAGQGPASTCKHVTCILYSLYRFHQDGQILTETTCTQRLQTFHRSKPYKGSPMKASDIRELRKQTFVYDPRPHPYRSRPSYPDEFRNTVINFQAAELSGRMPILQLYQPANPQLTSWMHSYDKTAEESFLTSAKISSISSSEREDLELRTRGQADSSVWLQERTKRVTASNFGSICKATQRRDLNLLASQLVSPRSFTSRATSHGKLYEPVAVEKFEKAVCATRECGLYVHPNYPWLSASPDRVVLHSPALLEVKCPYTAKEKEICHQTVPYLKKDGSALILDKNHPYYYQVQGQLACSCAEFCYFCVYTLKDFKVIKIYRDEQFIAKMISKLNEFYRNHFEVALFQRHVYRFYSHYF